MPTKVRRVIHGVGFSEAEVRSIRALSLAGTTDAALSLRFHTSVATISKLTRRRAQPVEVTAASPPRAGLSGAGR
jgi:hypothetical protein